MLVDEPAVGEMTRQHNALTLYSIRSPWGVFPQWRRYSHGKNSLPVSVKSL